MQKGQVNKDSKDE